MFDADVFVTPESIDALLALFRAARNAGGERFVKGLRLHCEQHGWDWFVPRGHEQAAEAANARPRERRSAIAADKRLFNNRAIMLVRALGFSDYAAMRREQLAEGHYAWWVYHSDGCERADHADLDGLALPPGDDFWAIYYPTIAPECGCHVSGTRTERGIRRQGGDPDKRLPDRLPDADPRWRLRTVDDLLYVLGFIASVEESPS